MLKIALVATVALAAAATASISAVAATADLTGVNNIAVEFTFNADVKDSAFNTADLQTTTELALRTVGVTVLDLNDKPKPVPSAVLMVVVGQKGGPEGLNAVTVNAELYEKAIVTRGGLQCKEIVSTWQDEYIGMASDDKLAAQAKEGVKEMVDALANEYLKDNPKPTPVQTMTP